MLNTRILDQPIITNENNINIFIYRLRSACNDCNFCFSIKIKSTISVSSVLLVERTFHPADILLEFVYLEQISEPLHCAAVKALRRVTSEDHQSLNLC
jgi:hypothetical protein